MPVSKRSLGRKFSKSEVRKRMNSKSKQAKIDAGYSYIMNTLGLSVQKDEEVQSTENV